MSPGPKNIKPLVSHHEQFQMYPSNTTAHGTGDRACVLATRMQISQGKKKNFQKNLPHVGRQMSQLEFHTLLYSLSYFNTGATTLAQPSYQCRLSWILNVLGRPRHQPESGGGSYSQTHTSWTGKAPPCLGSRYRTSLTRKVVNGKGPKEKHNQVSPTGKFIYKKKPGQQIGYNNRPNKL